MSDASQPAMILARVRDVVCGMPVELRDEIRLHRETWHGRAYFFCSAGCHDRFRASPERYVPGTVASTTGVSGTPGARLIWLPLLGITSADADRIELGLNRLTGVESVAVNGTGGLVTVLFDPARVAVDDFVEALRGMGVAVPVATLRLPIDGMYCASCAVSVERELERTHGVHVATVNPATEEATVVYEPAKVAVAHLRAAVQRAGYALRDEAPR